MTLPTRCPKPRKAKKRPRRFGSTLALPTESTLKRSGRLKAKKRPAKETERIYGPEERREWTKRQPCIVPGCGRVPCDAAHLISGGTGRKSDAAWTVALCSTIPATGYLGHHEQFDAAKKSFPKEHHLDMPAEAAANQLRWQEHLNHPRTREHHDDRSST